MASGFFSVSEENFSNIFVKLIYINSDPIVAASVAMTRKRPVSDAPSLSGTNLQRAGDYNQRVTLQAIRVNGPCTRAELAEITGLTAPSISNITKRLQDDGLILEAGRRTGQRGSPATRLAINPEGCFSIGVNIDRDHVSAALVDFSGAIRARFIEAVDYPMPEDARKILERALNQLMKDRQPLDTRLIGVGVALPDDMGGVAFQNRPANYGVWNSTNLKRLFPTLAHLPLYTENDAAAAALAELHFGDGERRSNFFYVLLTWGLGGSLVIRGEVYRGADGRSGEIGFLPVSGQAKDGVHLQEIVSLSTLSGRLSNAGFAVHSPADLLDLPPGAQSIVETWLMDTIEQLTPALLAINSLINPEAVFIGGRLPQPFLSQLVQGLSARLPKAEAAPIIAPTLAASFGEDAPLIGAAMLPIWDRLLPTDSALRKVVS